MRKSIFYILGLSFFLSNCTFLSNVKNYSNTSKELINSIVNEDYNKAYDLFAYEKYGEISKDTFNVQIDNFRTLVVNNFGTEFDLSFTHAEKTTFNTDDPGPHPTKVQVQIKNDTHYGYFTVLFDDEVNQVMNINLESIKNEIPSMTFFWLYGILPILVVGFNIYTIRRVTKSNVKRKWLKIIGSVLLNIPAFTFSIVDGLEIEPLTFQFLLGMSFGFMGYAGTYWTFGLPIGSLIANYKINQAKKVEPNLNPEVQIAYNTDNKTE